MAGETYVKVTKDMAYNLDQVSKSLEEIGKLEKGVLQGFIDITKNSTATGQAWIALARFFSGTGFWKIQNKVKAFSNALQFQQKLQENRIKAETELTNRVAETDNNLRTVLKTQEALKGILDGTASLEDKRNIFGSKYFKVLQKRYGTRQAILKLVERTETAEEKAAEFSESLNNTRAKELRNQFKRMQMMEDEINYISQIANASQEHLDRQSELQSKLDDYNKGLIISKDNLKEMNDEQLKLAGMLQDTQQEYILLTRKYTDLQRDIANATDEDEKKRLQELKDKIDEDKKKLEEKAASLESDLQGEGIIANKNAAGGITGFDSTNAEQTGLLEGILKGTKAEKIYRAWQKRHMLKLYLWRQKNTFQSFLKGASSGKAIMQLIGKALLFFVQFFLIAGLIILLLITLKSLGVIDYIILLVKKVFEVGGVVMTVLSGLLEAGAVVIADLIQFISDIFSADGDFVASGYKLIKSLGGFLLKLLVGAGIVVFELIKVVGYALFGFMKDYFKEQGLKGFLKLVGFVGIIFAAWYVASITIAALTSGPIVATILLVLALIGGVASMIDGKAMGGPASGLTVVGEKGPELVNLPRGSHVYSNNDSRQIAAGSTNNITVNVQGRVGASDAELRDIANKVGRLISLEVNRTTSSGTRI
tara:strand:+ start:4094 stop:6046 length:1953 start_codon:yes stop_codon:yes gene_type:complete